MSTSLSGGASAAVDPVQRDALYRKLTWHIIPFLFLAFIVAYIDRVNVSFAKLEMLADLSLSETVYGAGAGVFFLGYFIFEVPSNLILHRVGARMWIARIMVTWSIISCLTMFTQGPVSFYVLRFLLGVAEAGFFPASCCICRSGSRRASARRSSRCSWWPFPCRVPSAARCRGGSCSTSAACRSWPAGSGCF